MRARPNGQPAKISLSAFLRGVHVPEKYQAGLRARQMMSLSRMTDIILLSSALNMLAIVGLFWNSANRLLLFGWAVFGLIVAIEGWRQHGRYLRRRSQRHGSRRALSDFTLISVLMGIFWGIAPIMVLDEQNVHGQMVMSIVSSGVMFAGGFLLSRLPAAALLFMVPTALGMSVAMFIHAGPASILISVLMLYYLAVLLAGIFWLHRQFVEQYLSEAAIGEQAHLISILIRDFEESTSDMLWQTNVSGALQDIPVLGTAVSSAGPDKGRLPEGVMFMSFFAPGGERDSLETEISARRAFRDIIVPVLSEDGEEKWWSITGKPVFEEDVFTGYRGVASDVTQARQIEARMQRMAHFDGLTGLANRTSMQDRLEQVLRAGPERGLCRALLLMDLDNFKWVNDTLGHQAGDELLRQCARRMLSLCGPSDFCARLGGDEFALIIARETPEALSAFVDMFSGQMAQPYEIWGSVVNCSASVGVRLFEAGLDARRMISHCDMSLYHAKHLGRARWCMFSPTLEREALEKSDIQKGLGLAIERDELRLHLQPVVDAHTHETIAFEALVRWQHPERGLIYPDAFIHHAEENGIMTRLGEWVIREAISHAAHLPEDIRIAINLSGVQMHSATLLPTFMNALAGHGLDASRIEVEVSEAALAGNADIALRRLHQLREHGIAIVLDDFGKGASTLRCLRRFPFDRIKIDCRLVSDVVADTAGVAITQAAVQLARSLGMRCTAEGVETDAQARLLQQIGCDALQGFFVSPAIPADEAAGLLGCPHDPARQHQAAGAASAIAPLRRRSGLA